MATAQAPTDWEQYYDRRDPAGRDRAGNARQPIRLRYVAIGGNRRCGWDLPRADHGG